MHHAVGGTARTSPDRHCKHTQTDKKGHICMLHAVGDALRDQDQLTKAAESEYLRQTNVTPTLVDEDQSCRE